MKESLKSIGWILLLTIAALPGVAIGAFIGAFGIPGSGNLSEAFISFWGLFIFLVVLLPQCLFVVSVVLSFIPKTRPYALRPAYVMAASPYLGLLLFWLM
jgi:hypothetical protein